MNVGAVGFGTEQRGRERGLLKHDGAKKHKENKREKIERKSPVKEKNPCVIDRISKAEIRRTAKVHKRTHVKY